MAVLCSGECLICTLRGKAEGPRFCATAVEQELSKQTSLNDKLQSLCRSLQSQNKLLKEQLDRKESLSQAEREQSNSLQQAMQSITARSVCTLL